MHVFIKKFTYLEKGVKCCGENFTNPKCLKAPIPNLDSSRTISAHARNITSLTYLNNHS